MLSDASGAEADSSSAVVSWVLAVAKARCASVACAGAAKNNRPEARAVENRAPVTLGACFPGSVQKAHRLRILVP